MQKYNNMIQEYAIWFLLYFGMSRYSNYRGVLILIYNNQTVKYTVAHISDKDCCLTPIV